MGVHRMGARGLLPGLLVLALVACLAACAKGSGHPQQQSSAPPASKTVWDKTLSWALAHWADLTAAQRSATAG